MAFDWTSIEGYREDMSADEKLELLNNYDPPAPAQPEPETAPAEPKNADPAPAPAAKSAAKPTNPLMTEVAWKRERDKLTSENGNLRKELSGLLCGQAVRGVLERFSDVLCVLIPELAPCIGFRQWNYHHK